MVDSKQQDTCFLLSNNYFLKTGIIREMKSEQVNFLVLLKQVTTELLKLDVLNGQWLKNVVVRLVHLKVILPLLLADTF